MDNGNISKNPQENTIIKTKIIETLPSQEKLDQKKICDKQETHNSNNSQNKFDLPSFKCESCSYESIWKHAVKRHQQTHSKGQNISEGNKKQKYKCESCSYTTNNWLGLQDHQKIHTLAFYIESNEASQRIMEQKESTLENELNTSVFTCKKCKYKTHDKDMFETHKKTHLLSKGQEVFYCNRCSFNSVYRQSYLRHMRNMHGKNSSKDEVLHCKYCTVTSASEEQLEQHMKTHEEEKNMEQILDLNNKKTTSPTQNETDLNDDCSNNLQNQNNNLPLENSKSQEILSVVQQNNLQKIAQNSTPVQKPYSRVRRGKYSDVPVKTTKNGLFECEHCSYQTAIRTALVKHQTKHLKNGNS